MYPFFPFPMPLLIFFLLFLRRIKDGTEGTIVLVGQLESLKKPAVALVRLAEGKIPLIVYFLFFIYPCYLNAMRQRLADMASCMAIPCHFKNMQDSLTFSH